MNKIAAALAIGALILAAPASAQRVPAPSPPQRSGAQIGVDLGAVLQRARSLARGCRQERRDVQMIRVIAVFGADDDGARATAAPIRAARGLQSAAAALRPYRPISPYLANAAGEDYVMEFIRRTNRVLANSEASFRLSENDVAYDLVRDTALNTQDTEAQGLAAQDFFRAKVLGPNADPRYAGRIVWHFPWGAGSAADGPRSSGASDVNSWFVAMPSRVFGGTMWGDEEVWGWYMAPHEFGHFMGLQHTFTWPAQELLEQLAQGSRGASMQSNKDGQLVPSFSYWGPGGRYAAQVQTPQLDHDIQFVGTMLNLAPVADADTGGFQRSIMIDPSVPFGAGNFAYSVSGVADTPADLGLGWSAAWRRASPCTALEGEVFGAPYSNVTNRTNPMSYTLCDTTGMRYTPGQLAVMQASLQLPHRAYAVHVENRNVEACRPAASQIARP